MDTMQTTGTMTRAEHLQWAKDRAIAIAKTGDVGEAFASFASDMNKHSQLHNNVGLGLMMQLYVSGHLSTPKAMEEFIDGFN